MLKVVQLSDCHVSAAPDEAYRGQDARACLERTVDAALDWTPDLVLATGDLSEDASEASYAYLAEVFGRFPVPVLVTTGNHDDGNRLARHFPQSAVGAPLVRDAAWRIIVLGSAKPGEIAGRLDESQLAALEAALEEADRPVLVALHHQPWLVGSPWIDRWPLLEPERFHALLARSAAVRLVLWGHVHQDVRHVEGHLVGLGAPSTVSNSLPGQERFTPDPAGPAARWLELAANGGFRTGLLRPGD